MDAEQEIGHLADPEKVARELLAMQSAAQVTPDRGVAVVNGEAVLEIGDSLHPSVTGKGDPLRRLIVAAEAAARSTPFATGARFDFNRGVQLVVAIPAKGADIHATWKTAVEAARAAVREYDTAINHAA